MGIGFVPRNADRESSNLSQVYGLFTKACWGLVTSGVIEAAQHMHLLFPVLGAARISFFSSRHHGMDGNRCFTGNFMAW